MEIQDKKPASKGEVKWITDRSRGHLISRRRTVFLSVVLDTFYYSLWCWYTDGGPVLEGLLSLFSHFPSHSLDATRAGIEDRPASRSAVTPPPCDTINTRLSSFAIVLTPYLIHIYTRQRALVDARARPNFLVSLSHSFSLSMQIVQAELRSQ